MHYVGALGPDACLLFQWEAVLLYKGDRLSLVCSVSEGHQELTLNAFKQTAINDIDHQK